LERGEGIGRDRWIILAVVYSSILAFALVFQSIPPILPLIISELHITYAQSGLLVSLFALPGLFVSLLGGFLSDRYSMRSLGAGCFALMVGGTFLVSVGKDLWVLSSGRIFAGMGGLMLSVLLPKLLSQWFRERELGLAMGIYNTGIPLGSVLSFSLFGKIGSLWGWRIPISLTGIYALITSILFLSFCRLPPSQRTEHTQSTGVYKSLKELGVPIWWVGISWLWFNAAFVSFATFAPHLFLKKGFTIEQSGLLIGIPLLGSLLLSAPAGYLVDRFRHQEWIIGIGGLGLSVIMFFFNLTSSFSLLVILLGIFSAMIPSPIYSLPSEMLKPGNVGLGFGVISTCSSIGLFLAPYLVGKTRDLTGSDQWSFLFISFFCLLIVVFIFFAHRSRNKIKSFVPSQPLYHTPRLRD
jgi:predicted MFS family arabinose efflux permease